MRTTLVLSRKGSALFLSRVWRYGLECRIREPTILTSNFAKGRGILTIKHDTQKTGLILEAGKINAPRAWPAHTEKRSKPRFFGESLWPGSSACGLVPPTMQANSTKQITAKPHDRNQWKVMQSQALQRTTVQSKAMRSNAKPCKARDAEQGDA